MLEPDYPGASFVNFRSILSPLRSKSYSEAFFSRRRALEDFLGCFSVTYFTISLEKGSSSMPISYGYEISSSLGRKDPFSCRNEGPLYIELLKTWLSYFGHMQSDCELAL